MYELRDGLDTLSCSRHYDHNILRLIIHTVSAVAVECNIIASQWWYDDLIVGQFLCPGSISEILPALRAVIILNITRLICGRFFRIYMIIGMACCRDYNGICGDLFRSCRVAEQPAAVVANVMRRSTCLCTGCLDCFYECQFMTGRDRDRFLNLILACRVTEQFVTPGALIVRFASVRITGWLYFLMEHQVMTARNHHRSVDLFRSCLIAEQFAASGAFIVRFISVVLAVCLFLCMELQNMAARNYNRGQYLLCSCRITEQPAALFAHVVGFVSVFRTGCCLCLNQSQLCMLARRGSCFFKAPGSGDRPVCIQPYGFPAVIIAHEGPCSGSQTHFCRSRLHNCQFRIPEIIAAFRKLISHSLRQC